MMRLHHLILFSLIVCPTVLPRPALGPERYESLTGKSLQKDIKGQWDLLYGRTSFVYGKKPAKFLAENYHIIPSQGTVLDVGMGEGRNAVFLASKGYNVTGVDISSVAIRKAEELAKEYDVHITSIIADAKKYQFKKQSFDAVLCFYYVDRELLLNLIELVKPGGYLFYEAYTIEQRKRMGNKPEDLESYYLKPGELKDLLKGLRMIRYEEGDVANEAKASALVRKI